jgi:hypothetical protein
MQARHQQESNPAVKQDQNHCNESGRGSSNQIIFLSTWQFQPNYFFSTDVAVPTKLFFSQITHSRYLEELSESIDFATQGVQRSA